MADQKICALDEDEKICGLDENEKSYIYLKHQDDIEIYQLPLSVTLVSDLLNSIVEADKTCIDNFSNPIIIKNGTSKDLKFIIQYLDFYKDKVELDAPEYPLSDSLELKDLFEDEYAIFGDIIESVGSNGATSTLDCLAELLQLANYCSMRKLLDKLSAIFAFILKGLTQVEIQEILKKE